MNDLLPFDLEKALSGKYEIIRGDNTPVEEIKVMDSDIPFPVMVVFNDASSINTYQRNGDYTPNCTNAYRLFLKPKPRKVWANIYYERNGVVNIGAVHNSLSEAEECRRPERFLKTVELEIPQE